MTLAPLGQLSCDNLRTELVKHQDALDQGKQMLGPQYGPNARKALRSIEDAIDAIKSEIAKRC